MFRMIKLALYALVGYALYELYQGMTQGGGLQTRGQQRGEQPFGERLNVGSRQNITGGGGGTSERTDEPAGTSTTHSVGRGVVH